MSLAQVAIPNEGLSSGYFQPLILAALVYTGLFIAARVMEGRGDPRSAKMEDFAFLVLLLTSAYVAILTVVALVSESELMWDLARILVVVAVFFAVLILLLLVVFERGIGGISRARRRARDG